MPQKNRHVTPEEWEKTMFSDESTFRLINPRAQKVRRSKQMNRYLSKYAIVLKEKLFPWMRMHGCNKFLQDGAPCYKSKASMALLRERASEFSVIDWPGNSPDLNPIENVWAIMKARLKSDHSITSLHKLMHAIKMMWMLLMEADVFKKLARSMPERLEAVINANGQMTKY